MRQQKIRNMGARPSRILGIGLLFLLVAVFYFGQLLYLRISGSTEIYTVYDGGNTKSVVSVPSLRGDIYDRNGRLLVTSRTYRNLTFTYQAIPDSSEDFNRTIAETVKALRLTNTKRTEAEFPLYGSYPDYGYYSEALEESHPYHKGLLSVLDALGLEPDASCKELVETLTQRYKLGRSELSDEELDNVFRVRYDMLRKGFGVYTEYVLAERVSEGLVTYVEELDIRGAVFSEEIERVYLYPGYASHILGQIGKIPEGEAEIYEALGYPMDATVGISGCESAFEFYLRGVDGTMVYEYDPEGHLIDCYYEKEPKAGKDVYLTIDIDVQVTAEKALKKNIEDIAASGGALTGGDADAGAVVALDPKDFSVVAIASYPTYDLSQYRISYSDLIADETLPLLNRALDGLYEPGSTFKIGVALAALEEHIVTPETEIIDTGVYTYYPGYQPRCWIYTEEGHGHGPIRIAEAIEVSCNYYFYDVGRLLGIDRMTAYMSRLGLGEKTGIELGGKTGILASPTYRDENGETPWQNGDTLQAAIGQSNNLFSPLQIAAYFGAVFNGGTRYSAHLLSSVREFYTGEETVSYTSGVESTITFSEQTYDTLMEGITSVIDHSATLSGYFANLKRAGVTVGGKTGTAQISASQSDNALFAAYAEFGGQELVAVCVIEHGATGAKAGYTVSQLMEAFFLDSDYEE